MKKWTATHTRDCVNFDTKTIEADTYTEALISFELKYPDEIICDLEESGG